MTSVAARLEIERLREMFQQAPGAKAILRGPDHVIEMANDALLQLVGARELHGKPVAVALPELVEQGFVELLDRVFRSGTAHVGKAVPVALRRSPCGALEERVVDFVYQPLKDVAGCVTSIFVEVADVTERVRAEAALRESEERYRYAFEAAAVSLWEEDCTEVQALIERLRAEGVSDFRAHFETHPEIVRDAVRLVRVRDVNQEAMRVFGARTKVELTASLGRTFTESSFDAFKELLIALAERRESCAAEAELLTLQGEPRRFVVAATFPMSPGALDRVLITLIDITERTRTERALRESEERYRAFVAHSSEAIWRYEMDEPLDVTLPVEAQIEHAYRHARLAELNDAMARMYGLEHAEQFIGARLEDTLPRDDPASKEYLRRVIESGFSVRDLESVERDAQGRQRHFTNTMVPGFQDGKLVRVWGVQREITERMRAEDALRRSEERLQSLFAQTLSGIAETDLDGRFLRANRRFCEIAGRSEAELLTLRMRDITHPEDLDRNVALLDALLRGESTGFEIEKRYVRPDGSVVWVHDSVSLVRDAEGKPQSAVATTIDITESRLIEEALRQSETRLRSMIDNMTGFVAMLDAEGTLLEVGEPALRVTGTRREDVIGKKLWECGWWSHDPGLRSKIEEWTRAAAKGATIREDVTARVGNDGRLAIDFMLAPVVAPDGTVTHVIPSAIDISVRKRMEMALREAAFALRDADRRKDEFLATIAHELRNPLAPIRNAVQLLKLTPHPVPQARTARDIIERQVQHMVRLVDDLLDVSRITLGHVNLKREPLTLGAVLSEALETARPALEAAGHSLHVELPGEQLQLEGDATRLSQVFQNLLDNATKYTPRGGRISVTAERRGEEAVVAVSDTGLGVPPDMQERIFELFTRCHSGGDVKVVGLGVGLALARQLVELHRGRMTVKSEGAGRGATFTVCLPLSVSAPSAVASTVEPQSAPYQRDRRILVVDDNRDAAESLRMLLEFLGCTVSVAFDGKQAIETFENCRADTVLLDIGMPEMDGYEVARRIRAGPRGSDVLLIALTGWGQDEDKRRARAAGFDEHLTKPVDPMLLNTLLNGRRAAVS
jgi:PAS domain S-box-containing protein